MPQQLSRLLLALLLLQFGAVGLEAQLPRIFPLDQGYISGFVAGEAEERGRTVLGFLGIPYAEPPVGDLRWRPPQPPSAFPVVPYDAVAPGPVCMQTDYPEGSFYPSPEGERSEDCLYLNVWSGADSPAERLPVMVWIHGGALTRGAGSSAIYDGTALAEKGVVVVTINYRLGVFGFFAHPALTTESRRIVGEGGRFGASGNYGLLDQIAALEWVRDNIAAFGGDPFNVTVFGESAGSWSVNVLQASPLARGLFQRVIGQSGAIFREMTPLAPSEPDGDLEGTAHGAGLALAEKLGVEAEASDALERLRALPATEVLEAASGRGAFSTEGIVDGWVLPREIREIFAVGEQADVPVMIGSNADEMTSLGGNRFSPPSLEVLEALVTTQVGSPEHARRVLEAYAPDADADPRAVMLAIMRDELFTRQMRQWAEAMETVSSQAWLYHFTRVPMHPERETYGAYHAAEIAYAFGNLDVLPYEHEPVDLELQEQMSELWVRFARDGRPSAPGVPEWPPYSRGEAHLELGSSIRTGTGLCGETCDVLDEVATATEED